MMEGEEVEDAAGVDMKGGVDTTVVEVEALNCNC